MKKIDALIDNTYKTVDDKAVIYLYLINSILKDRDFNPYFYVELNKDKVEDEDIETIKEFLLKKQSSHHNLSLDYNHLKSRSLHLLKS